MNTYQLLPVDSLQPGLYQPRINFEPTALQELADSIATQGLIEPLIVREITTGFYEIIAGERRWRACKLAGLTEVPCLLGEYSDEQAATVTLVENIQRQELNLIEEASGYKRLIEEFHFQQEQIAKLVGKSRSHIANLLRLLTLCPDVQDSIRAGQLSLGHARLLVGMLPAKQLQLLSEIQKHSWSVRFLEEKIKQLKNKSNLEAINSFKNQDIVKLESLVADHIGAPVQIHCGHGQGGWLQVQFFDNDTLSGLLERMGLKQLDQHF
jgi:ParB family chromosome partitioning protein